MLPCPGLLLCIVADCAYSVRNVLLLLAGDVELNPGPMSDAQAKQFADMLTLLQDLSTRSVKIEEGQCSLIQTVNEIKANQTQIESKIEVIGRRIDSVESVTTDIRKELTEAREVIKSVQEDNASLQSRLDDFEDRSRRENLIFHGVTGDSRSETWEQTGSKIIEILSRSVDPQITSESIDRAHRLGYFSDDRCRPVIVKFASYKLKDKVLSLRSTLKNAGTTVNEDFCLATRQARKKLLQFGTSQNATFKLRYNKLFIGQTSYIYDQLTNSVRQADLRSGGLSAPTIAVNNQTQNASHAAPTL